MTSPNSVTLRESEERAPKQGATAKFGVVIDGGGGIWEIDGSKKLSQLTANGGCGAKALDTMPALATTLILTFETATAAESEPEGEPAGCGGSSLPFRLCLVRRSA